VFSPGNAGYDRVKKVPKYARNGITNVWIIDPVLRILEVYRLDGEHYLLISAHDGTEHVKAEPFDAIELDLDLLWLKE